MKQIVSRIALAALVLATAVPSFAATEPRNTAQISEKRIVSSGQPIGSKRT